VTQIDAIATHRYPLCKQQGSLSPALRETPVGSDDAMPRDIVVDRRQDEPDEAGRAWIDVPVGADKPSRDGAHPAHDARGALFWAVSFPPSFSGSSGHARAAQDKACGDRAPSADQFDVVRIGGPVNQRRCLRWDDCNATRP
jgi:hypothetical protein